MTEGVTDMRVIQGDCVEVMAAMPEASVDAIVTDPPYGLEFMGKAWDRLAPPDANIGKTNIDLRPATQSGADDLSDRLGVNYNSSRNLRCRRCGHWRYSGTPCRCPEGGDFPNVRANEGAAMQAWHERWAREALRVLKPGGHLLAFGGTRTFHRLACALEDAGFEIRDTIMWVYGSGFPKSLNVGKAIDKAAGAEREVVGDKLDRPGYHLHGHNGGEAFGHGLSSSTPETRAKAADITAPATDAARQWGGWGTALKPAHEPIIVARKPLAGTVAANVAKHGTGGLNVDACRVAAVGGSPAEARRESARVSGNAPMQERVLGIETAVEAESMGRIGRRGSAEVYMAERAGERIGRFPANVVLSHLPECRCVGTKRVRAISGGAQTSVGYHGGITAGERHADADGMETVEAWECIEGCPVAELDRQSGPRKAGGVVRGTEPSRTGQSGVYGTFSRVANEPHDDAGGASRFFPTFRYQAKASGKERSFYCPACDAAFRGKEARAVHEAHGKLEWHPTRKPLDLIRWLVRLVTPPGGTVLDPFAGTGTTGEACAAEGFDCILIEREPKYVKMASAVLEVGPEGTVEPDPFADDPDFPPRAR